jgi:hypothetical protein
MARGPLRAPAHTLDLPSPTRNVCFGSGTGAAELRDQAHAGDAIGTSCNVGKKVDVHWSAGPGAVLTEVAAQRG